MYKVSFPLCTDEMKSDSVELVATVFWRFYWYPRMALGASLGLDDDQYKNRVSWSNLQMASQEQNLHRTEREQLDELK